MKPIPESMYSQIHALMPIFCIDLAIVVGGAVLLLRRNIKPDAGKFWFPGGRLFKGESFKDAARRIALDEVGMRIEFGEMIGFTNCIFPEDPFGHGKKTHTCSLVFQCSPLGDGTPRINDEHSQALWWMGETSLDIPDVVRPLAMKAIGG